MIDTAGIAFHSPKILQVKEKMLEKMRAVVSKPKIRSSKWVSTSIPEERLEDELALYCSADYHVSNLLNEMPFQFQTLTKHCR